MTKHIDYYKTAYIPKSNVEYESTDYKISSFRYFNGSNKSIQ